MTIRAQAGASVVNQARQGWSPESATTWLFLSITTGPGLEQLQGVFFKSS